MAALWKLLSNACSELTCAVFPMSVSATYESVENSFVSRHVTYDIKDKQEYDTGYDQDYH